MLDLCSNSEQPKEIFSIKNEFTKKAIFIKKKTHNE